MCGIAGYAGPAVETRLPSVRRMLDALRHRGPDDRGCEAVCARDSGGVVLGNTRLAILDVSPAGHQPMRDPATGNWLVLNGEIYNHLELRGLLPGPWRSRSDTETVLAGYREWGAGVLGRLRGMFALALWDHAGQTLLCARDRLGIKPFYYHASDAGLLFASELRALLASGLLPFAVDPRGLAGFVRFGAVPDPLTLLAGVASLPAGHSMTVSGGRAPAPRSYWEPRPVAADTGEAPLAQLRHELRRAVGEHLLSDVPVASFLSGGVDSSVVTAVAASVSAQPIACFTVGFGESALDETEAAARVAQRHGLRHSVVRLAEAELAALAPRAVAALDQPSADGFNTWIVSRAVAEAGYKVVLSGLGGDEVFGGYSAHRLLPRAEAWAPLLGRLPRALVAFAAGGGGKGERAAELTGRAVGLRERYEAVRALWSKRELEAMGLDPDVPSGAQDPGPDLPLVTRTSVLELSGYMRSTLLRDSDAMSMAHSLELRVPLLDHRLVERALALRARAEGRGGPKWQLLEAARDVLPEGVAGRPKQGFVLPMERWMRGPLTGWVDGGLDLAGAAGLAPRLDTRALGARFRDGRLAWSRLWQFAVLGHWLDGARQRLAA